MLFKKRVKLIKELESGAPQLIGNKPRLEFYSVPAPQ
jgi:hypothetical protein